MKAIIPCFMLLLMFYSLPVKAFASYYSYEEMEEDVSFLQKKYSDETVRMGSIGTSEWGKDIPFIQLGKGKQHVFLIGAHHAREWITSQFLMKLVEEYVKAYAANTTINGYSLANLDEISLVFIPMLNPDGVTIQQKGIKGFSLSRKIQLLSMNSFYPSFKRWKANGEGVDLNRQYPAGWNELNPFPAWSYYKQYRGTKPIQAKEVKALVNFTYEQQPVLSLAYHTSGQQVFWYYKTQKEYIERDYKLAGKVGQMTGYELDFPTGNAVGGGYTDWFIQTFHKPAFTMEMCESVYETNPPTSCLQKEWERNKSVPLMLIDELLKNEY